MADTDATAVVDEKGDRARARLKEKRFRHNWRIDMLAVPKGHTEEVEMFKMTPKEKDDYLQEKTSKVSVKKSQPKVQDEKAVTKRLNELASFPPRFYSVQKKIFRETLGKKFEQRMDKRGKVSYNSQYYEYTRAKKAYKKRSKSRGRSKSKEKAKGKRDASKSPARSKPRKSKEEKKKELMEWCATAAKPKKLFPPEKINRGKRAELTALQTRLVKMSKPRWLYVSPSQDSMNINNIGRVKPNALKYKITYRTTELAHPSRFRMMREEPIEPGTVEPGALTAVVTERIKTLAVPRPRATSTESDYREFPIPISPGALKYVATPRIQELAKPIDRR